MNKAFSFEEISNSALVKQTCKSLFGSKPIEAVTRPASFVIRLCQEPEDKIFRIILLPPKGFTADRINETNPYPEARKARIKIKGGIRPGKKGFSLIKKAVKFVYFTKREIETMQNTTHAKINPKNPFYKEAIKNSNEKFFVVKENGEGFYHSLINMSEEWLLLTCYVTTHMTPFFCLSLNI